MSALNDEPNPGLNSPSVSFPSARDDFRAIGHGITPKPEPQPQPVDPTAPFLPEDVRSIGRSYNQIDYAIRKNQNPSARLNMYARMNDIRAMAEVAKNHSALSPEELDATARQLDMPPNLVAMMKDQYPDELEQRKSFAQMLEVAGADSYFATRFSKDPKYQAYMRGHEMAFADIQAALKNTYASDAEIMAGWGVNAAKNAFVDSVYGIPAGLSQAARDFRNREWTPQEEIPVDETMTPEERIQVEGMNLQTRERNAMMEELLADPEAQEQAAANEQFLSGVDDWLQDTYQDQKASAYAGDTRTGNWVMDEIARPVIEGIPSLATSAAEAALLGPVAPLVHFGLQAQTGSYRDMRAEGVDPTTALAVSAGRGMVEGYVEKLSIQNIFKGAGVRELFRGVTGASTTLASRVGRVGGHALKAGLGEGAEEVVQGVAESAATPLAKAISIGDPYSNVFSDIYEGRGDLMKQGWGGFALGVLSGGLLGNSRRELSDMRRYNAFQRSAAPLVAAGDAAVKGGKSVAEARQEIRTMAHEAVANGDGMGTTVYADPGDVESYLQGKPREAAEKTLAAIGVTPEAYRQAQADKTDIEIPIENLAVQEGGSDPELVKLFRPTPNMATATATAKKMQDAAGLFDTARQLRRTIDADVEGKVVPETIRVFRQDLVNNLNYRAQDADFVASIAWAYAKTQAERRGIDIDKFFAGSTVGNIRAAMDGWIRQNPAWLAGVRDIQGNFAEGEEEIAEEEIINADIESALTGFDPALGEGTLDVPEQPGDQSAGIPEPEPATAAQPVDTGSGGAVGSPVQSPAPEPERTLFAPPPRSARPGEYADALTGLPFTMETVSTSGVKTDPGAFQFKRDADAETGVKKGQEIPGDVNPAALGTMVFFEDVDGDRFVVSGHHRIDLLRRKDEEAEVRAVILRERDGWNTDQARVYGAALNIQEGGGDTDDYATFFRETRGSLDPDRAEAEGLLRRKNAQTGYAIGALGSDRVFYDFLNGELTARQAATIAAAAPGDHTIQDMIIERKIPAAEMETFAGYVKKMQNSGALNLDGVQLSLFSGKDHSAMLAAMEKESKAAAKEAAELDKKAGSLESLLKAGKTLSTAELRKHGARAGDRDGLRLEAEALRVEADRWRKFYQNPDILAQVQERAGTAVKPETYAQEARPAAERIGDLYEMAVKLPQENRIFENIGSVSTDIAERVYRETGIDISGYTYMVDASAIHHAMGKHGEGTEKATDQTPISKREFQRIPDVLTAPDTVEYLGKNDKVLDLLRFGKSFDGVLYVVDEVRTGRKKLALATMYKKRGLASSTTSKTYLSQEQAQRATAPSTPSTIPADPDVVNPDETFNQDARRVERGKVDLYRADATHRQAAVIRIMKGGDTSSVLHELAHVFLADMRDYVSSDNADTDTVRDYGKLRQAAGDLSKDDSNTENVEQVARWFEEYFREGRAPSVELVRPFGLFSKWLTKVYSNIREYVGSEMNPETRGVFDRWLASERDIAEAEAYYGGLNSASFVNLIDDEEKRQKLAEELERKRQYVLSRHAGKMSKAWLDANADRDRLTEETKREVMATPVYRAIEAARTTGIDRAAAEKTVGKGTIQKIIDTHGDIFSGKPRSVEMEELESILRKAGYHEADPVALFLKELSGAEPWTEAVRKAPASHVNQRRHFKALAAIRSEGGIDPDALAFLTDIDMDGLERHPGLFRADARENLDRIAVAAGFKTPSEMLDAMAKAPNAEAVAAPLTERKIRAKAKEARGWAEDSLAGVMDATSAAGQAAFHDPDEDATGESIELQRDALRDAIEARTSRRQVYVSRRAMEDGAKQTLFAQSLRDAMNYNNHAKAERYWSTAAAEAMANGDREAALAALDKQQKFHALTTAAFRIRRDYTDFMRRYGQRVAQSELSSVESAYRDSVRDILTFTGIVEDKSGRFTPENAEPNRLLLPKPVRDEFDTTKNKNGDTVIEASAEIFHPDMQTLIPEWIRNKALPRGYMGNVLDLTPAHMADIDASVKTLIQYGREELTALQDGDNRRVSDLRDKLITVMETLPKRRALHPKEKKADQIRSGLEDYLFGNLSIDTLAAEVDGFSMHQGKGMGLMQTLVDKIRNGEVRQAELLDTFHSATAEDLRTLDAFSARLKRENGTFFNPEGVPSPDELTGNEHAATEWDSRKVLAVMFNAGNNGNLYALQQGYGLSDAQLNSLLSLATEREWLAVQRMAKNMESLFPLMDATHYALTNRHLEKVRSEKFRVETADGKELELDGWYYPLVFDPVLSDRAAQNAEAADYRVAMNAIFNPQKLRDGFTKSRVVDEEGNPVVTAPPLLDTQIIIDHMTTATRWIALAEPLMDFRRVTMDSGFKEAFIQKLGVKRYRDLRMWTNRMARPDKGIEEGMNRLIRRFRNASTVAALGLNLRSAVLQLSSGGLAADEMSKASGGKASGWYYMWRGLRKMGVRGSLSRMLSPLGFTSPATEEMFRLSPEAKYRAGNVNKEIRDALNRFNPLQGTLSRNWARVKESLFHFTVSVDHMVSGAAWWGAYEQANAGKAGFDVKGLTKEEIEAKAVAYANRIVRTQQSPYQADYTRLQADNGAVSLMTQFMGGLTPYLNSTYVNVQLARRLGWKHAIPLSTHLLNAYILPSVAMTMLSREFWSRLVGDDEEDEEYGLEWDLAEAIVGQSVGALPGIRDLTRLGMRAVRTGRTDYSALASALPSAVAMPARITLRAASATNNLLNGDAYAAGKDVGMATAEILGVSAPFRQLTPLAEEWGLVDEE